MRALTKKMDIDQKSGTLEQAGLRYGFGRNSMRKVARNCRSNHQNWEIFRVNFTILDKYMDSISGE